jgi:hypothetical protein
MALKMLLGEAPPSLADVVICAETIRALRNDGAEPCSDGLEQALEWIGDRRDGYGDGDGDGSGYGDGDGDGYG